MEINKIYQGDALEIIQKMPNESIDCCITSPPYWSLRDYGIPGQLGLEPTFDLYIQHLLQIFDEIKRVLKPTGCVFVNLGDTYASGGGRAVERSQKRQSAIDTGAYPDYSPNSKLRGKMGKSLCCIPDRFKIAMVDTGWICRNEIIWWKRNCMPASVKDRFTVDFEKVFFFVKNKKYWFEQQFEESVDPESFTGRRPRRRPKLANYDGKIKPDGWLNDVGKTYPQRNKRCVWDIPTTPFSGAHFAVFPEALVEPMIKSGCPEDGIVLDPFLGSGTVAVVAKKLYRNYIGIELNQEYIKMAEKRIDKTWVNMELV